MKGKFAQLVDHAPHSVWVQCGVCVHPEEVVNEVVALVSRHIEEVERARIQRYELTSAKEKVAECALVQLVEYCVSVKCGNQRGVVQAHGGQQVYEAQLKQASTVCCEPEEGVQLLGIVVIWLGNVRSSGRTTQMPGDDG